MWLSYPVDLHARIRVLLVQISVVCIQKENKKQALVFKDFVIIYTKKHDVENLHLKKTDYVLNMERSVSLFYLPMVIAAVEVNITVVFVYD